MKSSREQFEAWMVGDEVQLDPMWLMRCAVEPEKYGINTVQRDWESWKASREAIGIELPRAACYAGYDNDYMMIADDVREAIADAGLKVKA